MGSLFNIVGDFQKLYQMGSEIEYETDPELSQVFADTLEALKGELEVKAAGYIQVIQQLEMEAERCKQLEYEWQMKKSHRENSIKRMKQALLDAMQETNHTELDTGDYKLKVVANGGKQPLVIDNPDKIPDSLTKVTIEPDKDRIREYLAEHEKCDFAHLAERGKHIAIK